MRQLSPGALLLVLLGGCATAANSAPGVVTDQAPDAPHYQSFAAFAAAVGPLESFESPLSNKNAPAPVVLVDGRQIGGEVDMPRSLGRVVFERLTDSEREAIGPSPEEPAATVPLDELTSADVRYVRVVRPGCETEPFGAAAQGGLIMIFTWAWDGPFPEPFDRPTHPCRTVQQ